MPESSIVSFSSSPAITISADELSLTVIFLAVIVSFPELPAISNLAVLSASNSFSVKSAKIESACALPTIVALLFAGSTTTF